VNQAAVTALLTLPDPELWVLTAQAGARRGGLITTTVVSLSIVPELPRVMVAVARQHHTWDLIAASRAFAVHLFDEAQLDWIWRFGIPSGRDRDKLAGLTLHVDANGSPILADAPAWLDCRVEAAFDVGDRTIYVAEVVEGSVARPFVPLRMKRLLELAPAERKLELKKGLLDDAVLDAVAIRGWRVASASGVA